MPRLFVVMSLALVLTTALAHGDSRDLAKRLQELEQEIAAEREQIERLQGQTHKDLYDQRRKLAAEALQLELQRQQLERQVQTVQDALVAARQQQKQSTDALQRAEQSAGVIADQLRLYLSELPHGTAFEDAFTDDYATLLRAIDAIDADAQQINVRSLKLRTATGRLESVQLLSVGHIAFAYRVDDRIGVAFASPADASGLRWRENISADLADQWRTAFTAVERGDQQRIDLPLDVAGRLRADAKLDDDSLWSTIIAGGPVMIPLFLVATLSALLLLERAWTLYLCNPRGDRLTMGAMRSIEASRPAAALELAKTHRGATARVLAAMLSRHDLGASAMEDSVQEQLLSETPRLNRFQRALGILAAVAPLLGLLGTVTGIIQTFSAIQVAGGADAGLMAGGISQALVTTAAGLTIAIPVLLLSGVMRGRAQTLIAHAEQSAARLLNALVHDRHASPREGDSA